jgi:isoquinoline 1-oxidoreductase alpha subunit
MPFTINVNGEDRQVDLPGAMPLLWVLRDELSLLGTKFGCGIAQCGACMVHVDGAAVRSCSLPLEAVGKGKVTTIEGIGTSPVGAALQAAWVT